MLLSRFSIHPPAVVVFSLDRMGHTALVLPHQPPTRLPLSPLTTHHWNATLVVPALVAEKPENVATATPQRGLV